MPAPIILIPARLAAHRLPGKPLANLGGEAMIVHVWRQKTAGALFIRATAPWGEGPLYHHIGVYAYRRAALERFVALPPSALERREKLEQLRALF